MKTNREYRNVFELRAKDNENFIVEGYATTFNKPYTLYRIGDYEVKEQISPNAFDECDLSDVIMQYDHKGRVFARNRNKTLELSTDSQGLFIRANLGSTEGSKSLFEDIKTGLIDRMSIGFIVGEDEKVYTTNHDTGVETCLRTIKKISKLYDVSAVSIPANDTTSISARNFSDGVIAEMEAERLLRAKLKLKLKLQGD